MKFFQLLLMIVLSACASTFSVSGIDNISLEQPIDGMTSSQLIYNPKDKQWLAAQLSGCYWGKSEIDPPVSGHQFTLKQSNNSEERFGQLMNNEIYIYGDPGIYVCHISAATAARFRALYQ
jgi:hypothetical protein